MRSLFVVAIISALFVASTFGASSASTASGSASSKPAWKKRSIKVIEGPKATRLISTYKNTTAGTASELRFVITALPNQDIRIRSTYVDIDKAAAEKTGVSFRIRFVALVEYLDANKDGLFTKGEKVSVYALGVNSKATATAGWTIGKVVVPADTASGIYTLNAKTNDDVFAIDFAMSGGSQTAAGAVVPPTQAKFNVTITNFPYTSADAAVRLALVARVESAAVAVDKNVDASTGSATVTRQVSVGGGGSFAWSDKVTVFGPSDTTGTVYAVTPSPLMPSTADADSAVTQDTSGSDDTDVAGEKPNFVVFNFQASKPFKIVWDPTVGADASIDQEPMTTSPASSLAVSVAIAAIAAIAVLLF